MGFTFLDIQ
jgi:hypothetical protein